MTRRPLELRELLAVTTMAAASAAILRLAIWEQDERWLLGLTLGTTIAAALIARFFGRSSARWGVLLGGLVGGGRTLYVLFRDRIPSFVQLQLENATDDEIFRVRCDNAASIFAIVLLAFLLSLIAWGTFRAVALALSTDESSWWARARRHPRWTLATLALGGGALVALANFEFLIEPQSLAPSQFVPLSAINRNPFSLYYIIRMSDLSRSGKWLTVETHEDRFGRILGEGQLFQLDPTVRLTTPTDWPQDPVFIAFDCDQDRVAVLDPQFAHPFATPKTCRLRVFDLERDTNETLDDAIDSNTIHAVQWLPGGTIIVHRGDQSRGGSGFIRFDLRNKEWQRSESETRAWFDARTTVYLAESKGSVEWIDPSRGGMRQELPARWSRSILDRRLGNHSIALAPNGRLILQENQVLDLETMESYDWRWLPDGTGPLLACGFTPQSSLACWNWELSPGDRFQRWARFLADVPLARRLLYWRQRRSMIFIDPRTGAELGRTRRLPDSPKYVNFSHDGSRMAVVTDTGAWIYDLAGKW